MQTRTCFNGGELAPEMAARCDVDAYMRGCQVLENWDVSQMGGIKRRRGMRDVCAALGSGSRLVAYEYTHASSDGVFLVELTYNIIRVLNGTGEELVRFESGKNGVTEFILDLSEVRTTQLNALLIITSRRNWPLVLRWDGFSEWTLRRVEYKSLPWRYEGEVRDNAVTVTSMRSNGETEYSVVFSPDESEEELPQEGVADTLRVSFFVEQAEARSSSVTLREGIAADASPTLSVVAHAKGDKIAVRGEDFLSYWVCKQDFSRNMYVSGLDDPSCYPDNFELSENASGFEDAEEATSVGWFASLSKGKKFKIRAGYWELYTCIKDFTEADIVPGLTSYGDYAGYFVHGIEVGDALPCKGKWSFYCSGLWYGSYEVRRSYSGRELEGEWETAGISFSRLSEAENAQLAGDEKDEECWLRLFLTRTKRLTDALGDGWPSDSCGNRLIVDGYKHDMVLHVDPYGKWRNGDKVDIGFTGQRIVKDWSWAAFGARYGYPLECEVYQQRLVFASTTAQPQTVWMSRTDDLYNFSTGDSADAAIVLTLYTTSQNPICWMLEDRGRLMLGTSNAEWVILAREGVVKPDGLEVARHGRIGSMGGVMLAAEDKALYVERGGARLWEFGYSFEVDGCRSRDLTVFAPHILREHGGVVQGALLRKPDTVAVFPLADGQVALMTYNTLHQVHAWHRWVTDGRVLSAAALPDGARGDRLFLVVERGGMVRIEVVDEDSPYMDAGGREYVSTLVTNALGNTLEQRISERCKEPAMVLFGKEGCDSEGLQVCTAGGAWAAFDRAPRVLRGWQRLLMFNKWELENALGLRFCAPSGCSILALQG